MRVLPFKMILPFSSTISSSGLRIRTRMRTTRCVLICLHLAEENLIILPPPFHIAEKKDKSLAALQAIRDSMTDSVTGVENIRSMSFLVSDHPNIFEP